MEEFKRGQYVVYRGPSVLELGRVVRKASDDSYFVVYSEGCTASRTPAGLLTPIMNEHVIKECSLGFHTFDDECPKYDPEVCFCGKEK